MPPRVKSGPGQCSKCDRSFADLLEHINKRHQQDRFQQYEVEEYGLRACICGRVVRNINGLAKHQSRFGCLGAGPDTRRYPVAPSAPSLTHISDSSLSSLPTGTSSLTSLPSSSSTLSAPSQPPSTPQPLQHARSSTLASAVTSIPSWTRSPSVHWIGHESSAPSRPLGRPPYLPRTDDSEEEEPLEDRLNDLIVESQDVMMVDGFSGSEGDNPDEIAPLGQPQVST